MLAIVPVLLAVPLVVGDSGLAPPLHFIIYGILAPLVFVTILVAGVELAWPGSLRLQRLLALLHVLREGEPPPFATESGFRVRCTVGGLVGVTLWCVAITLWLAGYLRDATGPSLSIAQASPRHALIFFFTLLLGGAGGYEWVTRMRQARDAAASLAVIAISMSLAGTILFFYIADPGLRDWFLALALGVVLGELAAAAQSPGLVLEGLFAVLFVAPSLPAEPAETELPPLDTVDADAWHAAAPPRSAWYSADQPDVWQPPPNYPSQAPRALIGAGSSSEPASSNADDRRPGEPRASDGEGDAPARSSGA